MKGCSSKQLERTLGVTYKTAWFMSHRIREAMRDTTGGLLGGNGLSTGGSGFGIGDFNSVAIAIPPHVPLMSSINLRARNRVYLLI